MLHGVKYLVPGNHDFCHTFHKKSRKTEEHARWIKQYEDYGWNVLPEQTTFFIPEVGEVNLCHHPYGNAQFEEDQYANWRPFNNGNWLLCGHIHEKWKTKEKMINVGVDVWDFKPVSILEITEIMKQEGSVR